MAKQIHKISYRLCLAPVLGFPGVTLAQSGTNPVRQTQPALTLALALTGLVLFFIYLYLKHNSGSQRDQARERQSLEARMEGTERALDALFSQHSLAAAKFSLDQGRLVDASPSFCRALGYARSEIVGRAAPDLGIPLQQSWEALTRELIQRGSVESKNICFITKSGERCHACILGILVHLNKDRQVVAIGLEPFTAAPSSERSSGSNASTSS